MRVAIFLPLTSTAFWGVVNQHCFCLVRRKANGLDVLVHVKAPREVSDVILARADHWPFREIVAVSSSPMLRPDGTILATKGYDAATQTYVTETVELPPIPDRPTREDAVRALALLADVLRGFPFASEAHRSAAFAAMLATVCRSRFPVVPATLLSAPQPGSGKSFFVDVDLDPRDRAAGCRDGGRR